MRSVIRHVADILEREATAEECDTIEIATRGKGHPQLSITVNNTSLHFILPSTPSDRRWILNWRAEFRRRYRKAKNA